MACSLVSRECLSSGSNLHSKTFTNLKFSSSVSVHVQISEFEGHDEMLVIQYMRSRGLILLVCHLYDAQSLYQMSNTKTVTAEQGIIGFLLSVCSAVQLYLTYRMRLYSLHKQFT